MIVTDFLSGDPDRVLTALWAVVHTRDPQVLAPVVAALPAIRQATEELELGGILVPNRRNLQHALDRVELVGKGVCLCAAYPSHLGYDPAKEENRQHVRIVDTRHNDQQWVPDRICECRDCGKLFRVEEGEYHYTWWKWTEVLA